MCRDEECLLVAKTSTAELPALLRWIADKHPYSVPETIALPIVSGSKPYLKWLADELK
jgi:periplasmic divalent cation tolerance protein